MSEETREMLSIIKELLELMIGELSAINDRLERIEKEQAYLRSLLLSAAREPKAVRTTSLMERLSSLLGREKPRNRLMEQYIAFLRENPEKIPLSGCFKKPSLRREGAP